MHCNVLNRYCLNNNYELFFFVQCHCLANSIAMAIKMFYDPYFDSDNSPMSIFQYHTSFAGNKFDDNFV